MTLYLQDTIHYLKSPNEVKSFLANTSSNPQQKSLSRLKFLGLFKYVISTHFMPMKNTLKINFSLFKSKKRMSAIPKN